MSLPDDQTAAEISYASHGRIICKSCDKQWCEHVAAIIVENLDNELIWAKLDAAFENDDEFVLVNVPMVPASNKFATAKLKPLEGTNDTVSVWFAESENAESVYIGMLTRGEGTMMIRDILFEYVLATNAMMKECASPSHQLQAQNQWQANLGTEYEMLERWCILQGGMCMYCSSNATQHSFDDFIPQDETRAASAFDWKKKKLT